MDNTLLNKCPNCGAGLNQANTDAIKCPYCGSSFNNPNPNRPSNPQPEKKIDVETLLQKTKPPMAKEKYMDSLRQAPRKPVSKTARIIAIVFILSIVFVFVKSIATLSDGISASSTADSLRTDTASAHSAKKDSSSRPVIDESSPDYAILKALSVIDVDSATFKKLYKATRVKHDKFSGSAFIYDKTSPQYVNNNGIYTYIAKTKETRELRLCIQYTASDWLFIKNVTFNADGQNYQYDPTFKTDNGDGAIWEWSDSFVTYEELPMVIAIINSKSAQAKYDGTNYYKVVNITPLQKAALKRQLQIYKGLILGYDK